MSTEKKILNSSWSNLTSDYSWSVDELHIIQNFGTNIVYIYESLTQPSVDEVGIALQNLRSAIVKQGSDNIYARSSGDSSLIIINEAPL